jgi:hypothetical protein
MHGERRNYNINDKKGKFHPITCYEGTDGMEV